MHPYRSPTRYPVCRDHSNAVTSGSWLAQFAQLICDNFTEQQKLASGGSDHQVSVQKGARLVLCSSLLLPVGVLGSSKQALLCAGPGQPTLQSTACAEPGNMRLPSCSGMQDATHLRSTQHTGLQAWEKHNLCISATQNTE